MNMKTDTMLTYCIAGDTVSRDSETVSNMCEPVATAQPYKSKGRRPARSIIATCTKFKVHRPTDIIMSNFEPDIQIVKPHRDNCQDNIINSHANRYVVSDFNVNLGSLQDGVEVKEYLNEQRIIIRSVKKGRWQTIMNTEFTGFHSTN